jgi:predicted nucleotidyltransferase
MVTMLQPERDRIFTAVRDVLLASMPQALAIYVYGSFARHEEWPDSDLDVAVLLPPAQEIPDLLGLMSEISQRVGRDTDVVNLRKVGDVLRHQVLADGQSLYISDPGVVLVWEASAMSRYARHREEIRDILDDFRQTGIGYER